MLNCSEKKCIKNHNPFCEVMIDFKTCLTPEPMTNSAVAEDIDIEANIEKICTEKIIIGGILHKTITYTIEVIDICSCKPKTKTITKHKDIPFSCFIDIKPCQSNDSFEIIDCKTVCNFSEIIKSNEKCSKKAVLVEKDIIKIILKKIPSHDDEFEKCKFHGKTVVSSELCFVQPVNSTNASVSVTINPANFKVMLVCCDLIVACGYITKTVTFTDDTPTAKKDVLVEINVPAIIDELDELNPANWKVTKAEVCTGCFNFTCPSVDSKALFHKLIEKDIVAIEVQHK